MTNWKRYTYGNSPHLLPLEDTPECWTDEDYLAAGYDPQDEEVTCARLAAPWNGHPQGSRVLTGLTVEGHPFAVEA